MKRLWLAAFLVVAAEVCAAAPAVELEMIDVRSGAKLSLGQLPPMPTLIHFWRSDCEPCLRELPWLAVEIRRRPAVRAIGIAVEEPDEAAAFLRQHAVDMPIYVTANPVADLVALGDKVGAIPFTAVLRADRTLCRTHLGELTSESLAADLSACGAR